MMMAKDKEIETGLITTGSKALGKHLIEEAQQKNREGVEGAVVGHVQTLLVQLSKQRDYIAQSEKNIALLQAKIAAVEAGAFSVATYGAISFTDAELNKGIIAMVECTNCGYNLRQQHR